jgi:hypothetical protein
MWPGENRRCAQSIWRHPRAKGFSHERRKDARAQSATQDLDYVADNKQEAPRFPKDSKAPMKLFKVTITAREAKQARDKKSTKP